MYTKEEIETFFSEHNIVLLSIESTPRKSKYNREVKVTVRCCVDGCQETVTKCFRNYTISKNFGCKDHCLALKTQKYKETQKQNKMEKSTGFEETKGDMDTNEHSHNDALVVVNKDTVQINDNDQEAIVETLELTEDLKTQFLKNHYFFEYQGQVWTKAKDVARFLEFKEPRNMIYNHVSKNNKLTFKQFPGNVQKNIISALGVLITHPETMFINDKGVFDLFMKSHKPIAKAMKHWLVYEVIPSITQKQNDIKKTTGFEETQGEMTNENSQNNTLVVVNEDTVLVSDKDQMIIDTTELTDDLKTQFLKNHYFFEYNGQAWTKANDVARFLDFKDARKIIYHHISDGDKLTFKQFPDTIRKDIISKHRNSVPVNQVSIQPETMFINDEGVFDLFMKSHKPIAKAMKRWLVYEVIPSIIKTGTYSIFPMPIAQTAIQEAAVAIADPRSTTCHNPNSFPISSVKSAIYILQLPLLNMYKFGYSTNLINRFKQHEYDFGEISIELILEAPDIQEIEKRLKTEIRAHGINTVFDIDGKKLKELFDPEHLNKVCEIAREIVDNYKTDVFTNSQNHEYRMACELLKQKQKDIEMKEKEIEMKGKDIEMKEKDIEMKDKDIKLAMELCKQKQYDIDILKLRIELIQTTKKKSRNMINSRNEVLFLNATNERL